MTQEQWNSRISFSAEDLRTELLKKYVEQSQAQQLNKNIASAPEFKNAVQSFKNNKLKYTKSSTKENITSKKPGREL